MLHGNRTYLLQDELGQIRETHSIAAGLDYPGVGPEHAWLKTQRPRRILRGHRRRGARGTAPALGNRGHHPGARERARGRLRGAAGAHDGEGPRDDRQSLGARRQGHANRRARVGSNAVSGQANVKKAVGRIEKTFAELRARGEAALIPFIVAGDPNLEATRALVLELAARGADLIELGVPFSDPMADGPANQRAIVRGLASGASLAAILAMVSELAPGEPDPDRAVRVLQPDPALRMRAAVRGRGACRRRRPAGGRPAARRGGRACAPGPRARPRHHLSARADHAGRACAHDRARGQRLSLLCRGDRRDRRPHQPRRRPRDAGARAARGDRLADGRRLRHLDRRAGGRGRRVSPTRSWSAARCR